VQSLNDYTSGNGLRGRKSIKPGRMYRWGQRNDLVPIDPT
jgi:hypothetical protein